MCSVLALFMAISSLEVLIEGYKRMFLYSSRKYILNKSDNWVGGWMSENTKIRQLLLVLTIIIENCKNCLPQNTP